MSQCYTPEFKKKLVRLHLEDGRTYKSITDRNITSDLAIRTPQKALDSQPAIKGEFILRSDQGSQYTSKAFTEFCFCKQSMKLIGSFSYV